MEFIINCKRSKFPHWKRKLIHIYDWIYFLILNLWKILKDLTGLINILMLTINRISIINWKFCKILSWLVV